MDGCNVEQDPVKPRREEEKYGAVLRRGETVETDVEQDPVESSRGKTVETVETLWTDGQKNPSQQLLPAFPQRICSPCISSGQGGRLEPKSGAASGAEEWWWELSSRAAAHVPCSLSVSSPHLLFWKGRTRFCPLQKLNQFSTS